MVMKRVYFKKVRIRFIAQIWIQARSQRRNLLKGTLAVFFMRDA